MEREQVKKILIFCRDIDGEILYSKKQLNGYEEKYYGMSGGTIDGMPRSKYKTSSPTESAALNIPDSASVTMRDLRGGIEQLSTLKAAILQELNKLTLPQKNILYAFYIQGLQWVRISAQVNYSETQCKKIRNRALDNLAKHFDKSERIRNFNYPY